MNICISLQSDIFKQMSSIYVNLRVQYADGRGCQGHYALFFGTIRSVSLSTCANSGLQKGARASGAAFEQLVIRQMSSFARRITSVGDATNGESV